MTVREGLARLEFEELDDVFFNPRGALARSFGVLAIRAFANFLSESQFLIADAFTGIGTRAVRYLLEAGDVVSEVHANDSSLTAIEFAIRNARINGVSEKLKVHCLEARRFFWRSIEANRFYHIIDLDVFGSPMQFIPFAVNALKRRGAIYITSTDTAPLCGINRRAAFRNYGAVTENTEFCHEAGARIVIAASILSAARQAFIGRPLFTLFDGYAFRIFLLLEKGRKSFPHNMIGFIFRCPETGEVKIVRQKHLGLSSMPCSVEPQVVGPLWIGDIHDIEFLQLMLDELHKNWFSQKDMHKIGKLIKLMMGEVGMPPFFHDISSLSDRLNIDTPRKIDLINALRRQGFKAGMTHFSGTGLKTDAPGSVLSETAKRLVKGRN